MREIDFRRLDARMPQVLRHAIDAHTAAKSLDGVQVAKVMKPERNTRRSTTDCLGEGRRDRNPRAVRRWKDQFAAPVEAGDMIERRRRQRYDSASIALAFDNFERSCRLVELRPFQRRQLGLACAGQTRRNGKVTQGGERLAKTA